MSLLVSLMLTVAFGDEAIDYPCTNRLFRITRDLLHAEGYTQINTCVGADHCSLEITPTRRLLDDGRYVYFARYTYGGAYPNYLDFTLTGNAECVIRDIHVEEM